MYSIANWGVGNKIFTEVTKIIKLLDEPDLDYPSCDARVREEYILNRNEYNRKCRNIIQEIVAPKKRIEDSIVVENDFTIVTQSDNITMILSIDFFGFAFSWNQDEGVVQESKKFKLALNETTTPKIMTEVEQKMDIHSNDDQNSSKPIGLELFSHSNGGHSIEPTSNSEMNNERMDSPLKSQYSINNDNNTNCGKSSGAFALAEKYKSIQSEMPKCTQGNHFRNKTVPEVILPDYNFIILW
jgi:hypothetical protein